MPLARRYSPEHAPGESALYGMDFSFVLGPGAAIVSASLSIYENTFMPASPSSDWQVGAVTVAGAVVYARLSGGVEGTDYQIRWQVADSDGNIWPRTALVLCALTS